MDGKTFAKTIYEAAAARAATPEGQAELQGVNPELFLGVVKALTDGIDTLDTKTTLHELMLGVGFVGSVIYATMEINKGKLEGKAEGSA